MSQRLFTVAKVGLFLDSYRTSIEKRRGEEVKVLQLTMRVQPFDAKLATAIDDGVGEESNVRATLFKLNHPDPKPHLDRVAFALGCPRQNLDVYASPDTADARLRFEQVKISGTYARTEKGVNDYAFVFKGTFGPVSRAEQEFIHEWFLSQRFVTFEEAEPGLFDDVEVEDDGEDEITDADEKARQAPQPPMWDDDDAPATAAKPAKEPARHLPRRHSDRNHAARAKQSAKKRGARA